MIGCLFRGGLFVVGMGMLLWGCVTFYNIRGWSAASLTPQQSKLMLQSLAVAFLGLLVLVAWRKLPPRRLYTVQRPRGPTRRILTKIAGVTHRNSDGSSRQANIEKLSPRDPLVLKREPSNKADPNAIAVLDTYGRQLGYLNADLAEELAPKLDMGRQHGACVKDVTGSETRGVNIQIDVARS